MKKILQAVKFKGNLLELVCFMKIKPSFTQKDLTGNSCCVFTQSISNLKQWMGLRSQRTTNTTRRK